MQKNQIQSQSLLRLIVRAEDVLGVLFHGWKFVHEEVALLTLPHFLEEFHQLALGILRRSDEVSKANAIFIRELTWLLREWIE